MKKIVLGVLAAGMALSVSTQAFALEGCSCATMSVPGTKVLGKVLSSSGSVTLDGAPVIEGSTVSAGSRIDTGADGAVRVAVGSCGTQLGANSSIAVSMTGPDVCVKVMQEGKLVLNEVSGNLAEGASTQAGQLPPIAFNPLFFIPIGLGIGALINAVDDDDDVPPAVVPPVVRPVSR